MKARLSKFKLVPALLIGVAFWISACKDDSPVEKKEDPKPVNFATQIKPLFQKHCIACHNTGTLLGKINLENRDVAFGESENGKFIVPKDPDSSLIYTITASKHGDKLPPGIEKPMPLEAPNLTKADKALLKRWIEEGANWPEGEEGYVPVPKVPTNES